MDLILESLDLGNWDDFSIFQFVTRTTVIKMF